MATLNWQTPNSTTGSIDLSKISLDDGSFTIHAKNSSSDYTLVGSHDHPDGRLVWNGQYFKVGHNNLASITESVNGDAIFYIEGKSSDEGGAQGTARLYGGSTFDSCASVIVYGTNHPINPGKFVLYARTASDYSVLSGNPEDRTLYWNSSPVLTTKSDLAASKITGAVPIAHGGTGATTRLAAAKNLLNENVGANATHFLTMTSNFENMGYSTVANAKNVLGLSSYLPLSGGTMTGGITFTIGTAIKSNNNTGGTIICGGSGTEAIAGAKLGLYGSSNSDNAGRFLLQAGNSSGTYKQLSGWPNGTLTWGGADILTASENKAINGYISFSNGIILQWGHGNIGDSNKWTDITFPIAFPTRMVSMSLSDAFTSSSGSTTEIPSIPGFTWLTEAYKTNSYKSKVRIGASGNNDGFIWMAVGY